MGLPQQIALMGIPPCVTFCRSSPHILPGAHIDRVVTRLERIKALDERVRVSRARVRVRVRLRLRLRVSTG